MDLVLDYFLYSDIKSRYRYSAVRILQKATAASATHDPSNQLDFQRYMVVAWEDYAIQAIRPPGRVPLL